MTDTLMRLLPLVGAAAGIGGIWFTRRTCWNRLWRELAEIRSDPQQPAAKEASAPPLIGWDTPEPSPVLFNMATGGYSTVAAIEAMKLRARTETGRGPARDVH